MTIDLHIHSKSSDGQLSISEIINEAKSRKIDFIAVTDHDSIVCQKDAQMLTKKQGICCISGVEMNVIFSHPSYHDGKPVSLDFLGYNFDIANQKLVNKLQKIAEYRKQRAENLLSNLNSELKKESFFTLAITDFVAIQKSVDGVIGRPHIADYLVQKGIVKTRQEAFDKYLVKCDVPKYPLPLEEASELIREAGGKAVLAHPNDPHGTSLVNLTSSLEEQTKIIETSMLTYIDGVECWHSRHDTSTTEHYIRFAKTNNLLLTGGSDCHQKPVIMGTVGIPAYVASQFLPE